MEHEPNDDGPALLIEWVSGYCPVQAEGTIDGLPFYFRSRGEQWTLGVGGTDPVSDPLWEYREEFGKWPDAGWISEEQARSFIEQAARLFHEREK